MGIAEISEAVKRRAFGPGDLALRRSPRPVRIRVGRQLDSVGCGLVIASFEHGEVWQSATGLYVYDDEGRHDESLPSSASARLNEVRELRGAIDGDSRPLHDGRWGMATMEVVLALMESSAERREIELHHQIAVRRHG